MERNHRVAQAVRLAITAGLTGFVAISPTLGQDLSDEQDTADTVAVQEKIVVTGSRIRRADYEGSLPVTVIDREDIDASGDMSLAELLRSQTFNTFGSDKQRSGERWGNNNTISMRGLGPWYTLILINGRRMASTPTESTSVQSLSMIPLAAVERVEVLRDGASAIYGTDALAGVVNIILRKDYTGINLSYAIGRPSQSGGDEDSYSITGGISSDKGNITFGMDVQKQDIVYSRDRDFTQFGSSYWGFPSSYFAYLSPDDPRNPVGSFLTVGTFPDPRCPAELGSDPEFPWSFEETNAWGGAECRYAYWGEAAKEAANDTKSFFIDVNYQLTDQAEFFARGIFSVNDVTGVYAPSPGIGLGMPQDAPQNPTNPDNPTNYLGNEFGGQSLEVDTDGDGVADMTIQGPFDLSLGYRNVPGGNRDHGWDDTLLDYVAGLRGLEEWFGGTEWEIAAQWSEQTTDSQSEGELLLPSLQSEIDAGNFDIFAVFGPYGEDEVAAASAATATSGYNGRHRIAGADAQITFDTLQLDNGPVPVVLGLEYLDEDYRFDLDAQTKAGAFGGGGVAIQDNSGARVVKSLFAETSIPVTGRLEVNLAGRYDDYNDFGTTLNPKVSLSFRPLDSLLLRSSYGTGFKAPELDILHFSPYRTAGSWIDSWQCSQTPEDADGDGRADGGEDELPGGHPCREQWRFDVEEWSANPDLDPEESENFTAGVVWSPSVDSSITLDYYHIQIKEQIWTETPQSMLDLELAQRQAGETGATVGRVTRDASGRVQTLRVSLENIEQAETDGLDLEATYSFGWAPLGQFTTRLLWTHVLSFEQDYPRNELGSQDWAGYVGFPEDRGRLSINWNRGDLAATVVGNYIADQDGGRPWDPDDDHLASFTTWDIQAGYTTPWNGLIAVGARNVFDRDPPRPVSGSDYDMTQYEIHGRVPYLRLEQSF